MSQYKYTYGEKFYSIIAHQTVIAQVLVVETLEWFLYSRDDVHSKQQKETCRQDS
jgi:hypothetical protein